jgi:predicted GNAT family acetyltransferase
MEFIKDFLDSIPRRGDVTPEELAARRQGYADMYQSGFLARNRDQTPPSVKAVDAAQEFLPVVGDAYALGEAYDAATRGELAAAGLLGAAGVVGLVPAAGDALARPIAAAGRGVLDFADRIEIDPSALGSLGGNVRLRPPANKANKGGRVAGDFDVARRDASSVFGEGTERVRYTDPASGGTIEVVARPDGRASVLELEVPEAFRGRGVGQSLQSRIMQDFPVMGGQVSSRAAATTAYRLGRRPYGQPDATLKDVFRAIDEDSSVNLISPQAQPTTPAPVDVSRGGGGQVKQSVEEMRRQANIERFGYDPNAVADETPSAGLLSQYVGEHRAPTRDGNAPAFNLAGDIYPDDIYSSNAVQYYGTGNTGMDRETMGLLQSLRGQPDAGVKIYRAVPKGVDDLNAGDWVTVNKQYAQDHGESALGGDFDIVERNVKASDIFTNGDSIHEFGYDPLPSLPVPRSASEAMARDILDLRAAGRADEVTEEMMAAADDTYMYFNTPIGMSVGERMQRSEAMGADLLEEFYHGTAKGGYVDTTDITSFDPNRVGDRWNADDRGFSITSSLQDANYYATPSEPGRGIDGLRNDNLRDGAIYPLVDFSSAPYNIKPKDSYQGTIGAWDERPDNTYQLMDAAGSDSARIYADGNEMRVVMDPRNLRSRFARFDPAFAHLRNLSAGVSGLGLLGLAAGGQPAQEGGT